MSDILTLSHIGRTFKKGKEKLVVLNDVNFSLGAGEVVALTGASGSGKSTLLHIMGLLDNPTTGHIVIDGHEVNKATDTLKTTLRRDKIGFIYQSHLLLPDFSALENVILPQKIAGIDDKTATERAKELLNLVGLSHRLKHRSGQLSGGEQQRVAIARALANKPVLLLADEPTGNLDPSSSAGVFDLLMSVVEQTHLSAMIATHNTDLAQAMHRRVCIVNGTLRTI